MSDRKLKPGWKFVKFGDVVRQCKESVDRDNNPFERYVEGGHMNTEDIHIRAWGEFGNDYVGPAFHRIFRKGQVLYGSRRTYLRKVAMAEFDGITANTTFVLESKDQNVFLQELLPFLMLTDKLTEHSIRESKGSTNPYINYPDIAKYEFPLPPIDEQKRIAEILWAADEVVEKWKRVKNRIAFTDKMLQANIFGENVNGGKKVELKKHVTLVSGQHIQAKAYRNSPPGIPYITGPADFPDGKIVVTKYTNTPKACCEPGDILVTCKGSGTGKIVEADRKYCISRQLMAVRPTAINGTLLKKYLEYLSEQFNDEAKGLIPGISRDDILSKKIDIEVIENPEQYTQKAEAVLVCNEVLEKQISAVYRLHKALTNALVA